MANLIPMETRRMRALVRLLAFWGAAAVAVAVGVGLLAANSRQRVAKAEDRLQTARHRYEGLKALIGGTRRLVNQRNALYRKEQAVSALRRDQRAIGALRDLAGISGEAIWFERVSLAEAAAKSSDKKASASGKSKRGFRVPKPTGRSGAGSATVGGPVDVLVTGFAMSQQELAEFLSRMTGHERFAGVELRWSSRTPFLEGQAVKFVIWGTYR